MDEKEKLEWQVYFDAFFNNTDDKDVLANQYHALKVALNLAYYGKRAKLVEQERKREDANI